MGDEQPHLASLCIFVCRVCVCIVVFENLWLVCKWWDDLTMGHQPVAWAWVRACPTINFDHTYCTAGQELKHGPRGSFEACVKGIATSHGWLLGPA
jgi:hypothetical protein